MEKKIKIFTFAYGQPDRKILGFFYAFSKAGIQYSSQYALAIQMAVFKDFVQKMCLLGTVL